MPVREQEVAEAGPGQLGVGARAGVGEGDGHGDGEGLPPVREHGDRHALAGAGLDRTRNDNNTFAFVLPTFVTPSRTSPGWPALLSFLIMIVKSD